MSRERLPDRRRSETFEFYSGNARMRATIGFYNDGRVGELFLHSIRSGSDRDTANYELAIAISFALQHGASVDDMRKAFPRTSTGDPEGTAGILLEILAETYNEKAA